MNVFLEESNLSSAGDEGSSNSTLLNLMEMHKNNALQTLLSAFVRCTAWPEVELPVARAIAHLVAIEDECDWQLLQQSAREVNTNPVIIWTQTLLLPPRPPHSLIH